MTIEELIKELMRCVKDSKKDPEHYHGVADDLLLKYINDKRVTKLFEKVEKYYA